MMRIGVKSDQSSWWRYYMETLSRLLGRNFLFHYYTKGEFIGGAPGAPDFVLKTYLKCIVFDIYIYTIIIVFWKYVYNTIEAKINQNDCIDPSSRQVKLSCSDENLNHMQSKYVPHHVNNKAQIGHLNAPKVFILKLMKLDVL